MVKGIFDLVVAAHYKDTQNQFKLLLWQKHFASDSSATASWTTHYFGGVCRAATNPSPSEASGDGIVRKL
jgi:hypothetical protein